MLRNKIYFHTPFPTLHSASVYAEWNMGVKYFTSCTTRCFCSNFQLTKSLCALSINNKLMNLSVRNINYVLYVFSPTRTIDCKILHRSSCWRTVESVQLMIQKQPRVFAFFSAYFFPFVSSSSHSPHFLHLYTLSLAKLRALVIVDGSFARQPWSRSGTSTREVLRDKQHYPATKTQTKRRE